MDKRTEELIAIGAAVAAHCQPCLAYHLGQARENGVSEEDVQAAMKVGFSVENGALKAIKRYSLEITKDPDFKAPCSCAGDNNEITKSCCCK